MADFNTSDVGGFNPKAEGQVYNIATGRETSVNQLAETIAAVTGTEFEAENIDRRDIDNIRRRCSIFEKIRRELRWTPSIILEQGLRRTYAWLVEHNSSFAKANKEDGAA